MARAQHHRTTVVGADPAQLRKGTLVSAQNLGASRNDLSMAVAALRAQIDEEFKVSERLGSKSRQAFALAAGFFAVVQTVTFGSFAQSQITTQERRWLLVAAVVAGLLVARVAYVLAQSEELHAEDDVKPEQIVNWCNDAAHEDYVAVRLVSELSTVARNRLDNNKKRTTHYAAVVSAARLSLFFASIELLVAIVVRV